jgi:DNA polymerase I
MDPVLYGHNPEERIVAVHQLDDQTIRLYQRNEGKILHKDAEFFPFFFLADSSLIDGFQKKFWLKELAGDNYYRFIAAFSRWSEMWEAIHYILREHNRKNSRRVSTYQELKEIFVRADPVRQFLLQSGITLFKGMAFEDLLRVSIDVQIHLAPAKKHKGKQEEQLLVVTLISDDKKEQLSATGKNGEKELIEEVVRRINALDPDVIEGYDLFGSILPALARCSERRNVPLTVGRDGSDLRSPARFGAASSESDWLSYDIAGRHCIDLRSLAEADLDAGKAVQQSNVISLARQFGIHANDGSSAPVESEQELWAREPQKVKAQSLRRAEATQRLSDLLSRQFFHLTQICPFNFRTIVLLGTLSRIESILLREYVHQKHSIPKPAEGSRTVSTPAEIFRTGVFSDVLYVELENMYPSIILAQRIKPKTDKLDIFLPLLELLTSLRRKTPTSGDSKSAGDDEAAARAGAAGLLLSSCHTYIGSAKALFNDPAQAETLNEAGKGIIKEITHQIELFNATIIQSDGGGFFILPPDNVVDEANERLFVERLTKTLPDGIGLSLSGRYKKMLSYRKRNFATMDGDGNVVIRGNALISRGMERYLRIFVHRFVECLLTSDFKRLHHTYASAYSQVIRHQWTPADFCRSEVARIDSEAYMGERDSEDFAPAPGMEAAARSSLYVKANAKIFYYVAGESPDVEITRSSRIAEEWDPNLPDENTAYYLARLNETVQKFKEFFDSSAFDRIVSMDEMFGFSEEGMRIVSRTITPESAESKPETEEYGIWLAETGD